MKAFSLRPLAAALIVCAVASHASAQAASQSTIQGGAQTATPVAANKPPIADFFNNPEFSGAKLSPSGRYLAAKLANPNGRERLAVVDLSNNTVKSVANFADTDVGHFSWVNEDRLVLDTTDRQVGQADVSYGPGLYAVNRDGESFRQLVNRSNSFVKTTSAVKLLPWHTFMLGQEGAQDSDDVYVTSPKFSGDSNADYVDLLKLNTRTGHYKTADRPADADQWLLDDKGEPRIVTAVDKGITSIQYRDPQTNAWRVLATFDTYTGNKDAFAPLAFGPDGTLYVSAYAGKDKAAVHTLDLATGKLSDQPLVKLDGYDFSGRLIMGNGKLLGVRYRANGDGVTWFDPAMQAIQDDVNARLPNTVNLVTPPRKASSPYLLVEAYSDTQPRVFLVYDSDKKTLNVAGHAYPRIKAEQMGKQEMVRYQARDGMSIPGWLTTPAAGGTQLPMVVLVHGGPYARGTWGWSPDAQFLASRGYAVLEPDYRGSIGYGNTHFRAGWKQWGLKMQDDVADGVKWAIAKGIADPKRICIAGASYGGYAAMMGLVNDPGLYRCGINWVGVTDITLMYTGHWTFRDDLAAMWRKYGMPTLIGDPVKDADQLQATSPLAQAARITQPLLLAYGRADRRVPLYHGTKFRDAVQATNRQVEWIEYEEEGHGWSLPKNRVDFWGKVEKFLDRHIGPGSH